MCYEEYKPGEEGFCKKELSCGHVFCAECFKEYYKSLITEQNKSHKLGCPEHGCPCEPTVEEVQRIIEEDVYQKYV